MERKMATVQDILQDLVSYSVPLNFEIIRVTGKEDSTLFEAVRADNRVIMKANTLNPVLEFSGQFGMPNLKVLKGYLETFTRLDADEKKTLTIDIQRNHKADPTVPTDFQFSLPGAATAVYRLRKETPKQANMKDGIKWDAEVVQPSRAKINEFNSFASILSDTEKNFSVKTVGNALKFYIGDENSSVSKVNFVFADGIKAKIDPQTYWPCQDFLAIMNLATNADTTFRITNLGVIQIVVDTGFITYNFMLPGSKT
jgi:hypothetical protein